jgi:signal transduction histidine kinase
MGLSMASGLKNNNAKQEGKKNRQDYSCLPGSENTGPSKGKFPNVFKLIMFWRRGVAQRMLMFIILFSSLVTLCATLLQLYLDYQRDVSAIERRLDSIERSYLDSISASLWNLDLEQLRLQLEGIMRLPDMQSIEVLEVEQNVDKPLLLTLGTKGDGSIIEREYLLKHPDKEKQRIIGKLHVEATLTEIYGKLVDRTVIILLSQGVKTFLVSMFILYSFFWLVTRHLSAISNFVVNYDLRHPAGELKLNRKKLPKEDELDQVVNSINEMSSSLVNAYEELRLLNSELEQDIVARIKAEEEIIRLNEVLEDRVQRRTADLEAANKELDAFCYSVSHDLRAPLRRVEGFRRILSDDYADKFDGQGRHYLQRIEAGTREMGEMIDSFLALSRSTRVSVKIENINLSETALDIARRLKEKEPSRKVKTTIEKDLVIRGDSKLLDVLLTNLFDNAWKYTRNIEHAQVQFGKKSIDSKDVYFVRDNGIGFDMRFVDRLFSPFVRLHASDEYEGVGVGLATVQRIVTRHGGRIWAESQTDKGAAFYFTIWEGKEK